MESHGRGWPLIAFGTLCLAFALLAYLARFPTNPLGASGFGHWARISYPMPTRPHQITSNGNLCVNLGILFGALALWYGIKQRLNPPNAWD